jgi:hypothetical protein
MVVYMRKCPSNPSDFRFSEFQGAGNPKVQTRNIGIPGDVYLDTDNHKIWYFNDSWIEWRQITHDATHPKDPTYFLAPMEDSFEWLHVRFYGEALAKAYSIFNGTIDPTLIVTLYSSRLIQKAHQQPVPTQQEPLAKKSRKFPDDDQRPYTKKPRVELDDRFLDCGTQFPANSPVVN